MYEYKYNQTVDLYGGHVISVSCCHKKIQHRYVINDDIYFRYTLDEYGTARRTAVVRGLIDALTRGGIVL